MSLSLLSYCAKWSSCLNEGFGDSSCALTVNLMGYSPPQLARVDGHHGAKWRGERANTVRVQHATPLKKGDVVIAEMHSSALC